MKKGSYWIRFIRERKLKRTFLSFVKLVLFCGTIRSHATYEENKTMQNFNTKRFYTVPVICMYCKKTFAEFCCFYAFGSAYL